MLRPDWDTYFLGICEAVAVRGDCVRRQVGALIVGQDHYIIQPGYNGSPPGRPGCLTDDACPRGRGEVPATGDYDLCIAIHAEANAIIKAGRRAQGGFIYVTHKPCLGCFKLIAGAQILRAIWPGNGVIEERFI